MSYLLVFAFGVAKSSQNRRTEVAAEAGALKDVADGHLLADHLGGGESQLREGVEAEATGSGLGAPRRQGASGLLHFCAGCVVADEAGLDTGQDALVLAGERRAAVFRHLPLIRTNSFQNLLARVLHLRMAADVVARVTVRRALTPCPRTEELLVAGFAFCLGAGLADIVLGAQGIRDLPGAVETRARRS